MKIRPAEGRDYEAFCRLFFQVNDLHAQAHPEVFQHTSQAPRTRDEFAALIADPATAIFVAEVEETVAGFVQIFLQEAPPLAIMTPRRFVKVDTLVVDAGYQRRGIGQALMDAAEEWARVNRASAMDLSVYEFNRPAIELYEKTGYQTVNRRMSKPLT